MKFTPKQADQLRDLFAAEVGTLAANDGRVGSVLMQAHGALNTMLPKGLPDVAMWVANLAVDALVKLAKDIEDEGAPVVVQAGTVDWEDRRG